MKQDKAVANKLAKAYGKPATGQPVDEVDLNKLAVKFLPIVKSEVARFKMRLPQHIEAEELHGVAIGGLMRALSRGVGADSEKFGAYVRQRVRGAILDELRRLDVFTRTVRKKARMYDQVVEKIEQREGRVATEQEIRDELGLSQSAFEQLLEELRPVSFLSLDEPPNENVQSAPLMDRLSDQSVDAVPKQIETKELAKLLEERMTMLPKMQQKIIHMYYFKDLSLAEIGKVFNRSESRICQIHTQAIRGLRLYLRRQMDR